MQPLKGCIFSCFLGRPNRTLHFNPISSDFCTQKEGACCFTLNIKYFPNNIYNIQKSTEITQLIEVFSLPYIPTPLTWNITKKRILVEVPVCLPFLSFIVIIWPSVILMTEKRTNSKGIINRKRIQTSHTSQ